MKFEFEYDDNSTYVFRVRELQIDPDDPDYDREDVRSYQLDTSTMALTTIEAEYAEPTVYLLDQDKLAFETHTQVFEHLFRMALEQSHPPADSELHAVLTSQLDQAKLVDDTLEFLDDIKVCVYLTALEGEAVVTYRRNGDTIHQAVVAYAGAPTVSNVLAALFPSHFDIDEGSRREQYRAELETTKRRLAFELSQIEGKLKAL